MGKRSVKDVLEFVTKNIISMYELSGGNNGATFGPVRAVQGLVGSG